MYNLSNLDISFNSLDSDTFRRILSIMHNNNNLRSISLNIFPSDENFTHLNIIKLSNNLEYRKNNTFIVDEIQDTLDRLMPEFETNLEYFIYILYSKLNSWNSIRINFDIPSIIMQNDNFNSIFYKFTLNMLNIFRSDDLKLQTLKLKSNNFKFSSITNTDLNDICDKITLCNNHSINNFSISVRFNNIDNLINLIPSSLKCLSIEELDYDTFVKFIETYDSPDYLPKLMILKLVLSNIYFSTQNIDIIFNFLKIYKRNLRQIKLYTKLKLDNEDINEIISIINKNTTCNYNLIFGKGKDSPDISYLNYYFEINPRIYSIMHVLNKLKLNKQNLKVMINALLKKQRQTVIKISYV
jgi:hypothetical protein